MRRLFIGIMFILLIPIIVNAKSAFIEGEKLEVTLSSCVDGDTAKFNTTDGIKSVRFLAIDTPESTTKIEEYGKEASEFTCNKLKSAKKIVLEFDKNSDLYDKYDRLLAWIFVDDTLLQDEIIKSGLGEVTYLYGDYKYTPLLQDHEAIAKANKLNIWSDEKSPVVTKTENKKIDTKDDLDSELIYLILLLLFPAFVLKNKKLIKKIIKKP